MSAIQPPFRGSRCVRRRVARASIALGALLIVLGLAGLVATAVAPRRFRGAVLLEIDHSPAGSSSDEWKAVSSPAVLGGVVAKLNLVNRWKASSAVEASWSLAEMIECRVEGGTDLVLLEVYSTDSGECAELANAVAAQYIEISTQTQAATVLADIQEKESALLVQEAKVEAARARRAALAEKFHITIPGTTQEKRENERDGVMRCFEQPIATLQREKEQQCETLRTQWAVVAEKEGDALVAAAAEVGLIDAKDRVCGLHVIRMVELRRVEGERHEPEHLALTSKLQSELAADRESVDARVKLLRSELKDRLRNSELMLENIRRLAAEEACFQQASDDYLREMEVLEKMIDGQQRIPLLQRSPSWIVEKATVPSTHARLNVELQLTCSLGSALAGVVLLFGGLIHHPRCVPRGPALP